MEFLQFAQAHGLIIREIEYGRWCRCPTEDHPRSTNGAFKHLGNIAFLQNHATMIAPAVWHPEHENEIRVNPLEIAKRRQRAERELAENRIKAAKKAAWVISQCSIEQHAYLDSKGFPEAKGMVWMRSETDNILVIPMRVGRNIVGVQMIDRDGEKKFLFGQRCDMAEYSIDAKGTHIFCEGYATGLSIRECLAAMKLRYHIHICFSAGNLEKMAKAIGSGIVIADCDQSGTGERVAKSTGLPYWISKTVGDDFNDFWKHAGTFKAGMELKKLLTKC